MVATLTVSGSQVICAALQTKLDISGDKQVLLERFLPSHRRIQLLMVHNNVSLFFINIKLNVIKDQ